MTRGKKRSGYSTSEPLYALWKGIISRCENPANNRFHRYGGRGIEVCKDWRDYETFRDWATSHGYRKGLQLDRINTDGDYEPDNCRFVTPKDQNRNRTNNRLVTAFGVTKTLVEWAEDRRSAVPYKVLWERLQDGWSFDRALTEPMRRKGGYRMIEAFGETKSVSEWVADSRCGVRSVGTLWTRINRNWSPERAVSVPERGK